MIQEELLLLLQDLCARSPYGVICQVDDGAAGLNDGKIIGIDISKEFVRLDADYYWDAYIDDVRPYLRPMSSMTEEEKEEYHKLCDSYYGIYFDSVLSIDWLNAHYFDYRGLIPRGLAIAVTKENNPYEMQRN